jgi:hypothetical protein
VPIIPLSYRCNTDLLFISPYSLDVALAWIPDVFFFVLFSYLIWMFAKIVFLFERRSISVWFISLLVFANFSLLLGSFITVAFAYKKDVWRFEEQHSSVQFLFNLNDLLPFTCGIVLLITVVYMFFRHMQILSVQFPHSSYVALVMTGRFRRIVAACGAFLLTFAAQFVFSWLWVPMPRHRQVLFLHPFYPPSL